jgi:hypothetical protein
MSHLDRNSYVATASQFKDFLGLLSAGNGYEEEEEVRFFRIF